ncbi:hypothetical protein FG379_001561 [Cryptosporidium bovis]|uniref:uncharacterized protein n=1 Tax=Cryptosporidium bovis TaxID=310047 RepID=UPI00351A7CB4|nr:hypothetical protein FG379_001561 [Cryptosporidium bovis]
MKLRLISSSISLLTIIIGVSKGLQLESKGILGDIVGRAVEGVKNGPVGSALMLPKDRLPGPYDDLSEDIKVATTDIQLEYESAKRRVAKFRNELMGPVDEVLSAKSASRTQLMTRLEYVGKLLRAAYDQAHPVIINSNNLLNIIDKAGLPIVLVQKTSADEMFFPPEGSDLSECAAQVQEADEEIELLSAPQPEDQTELLEQMEDDERYSYSSGMARFFEEKANALKSDLSNSLNTWINNQLIPNT